MKPRATRSAIRVERRHGRGDARAAMLRLLAGRQPDRPDRQPKPAPALLPAAIVSTSGLLARNISQLIWHGKGKFHEDLWG